MIRILTYFKGKERHLKDFKLRIMWLAWRFGDTTVVWFKEWIRVRPLWSREEQWVAATNDPGKEWRWVSCYECGFNNYLSSSSSFFSLDTSCHAPCTDKHRISTQYILVQWTINCSKSAKFQDKFSPFNITSL